MTESGEKIYNLKDLDTNPKATFQVKPEYPDELHNSGTEGYVVVEWVISRDGVEPVVKKSSHTAFEQPAIDSISASRWEPGMIDGKPVNVLVGQRLNFDL